MHVSRYLCGDLASLFSPWLVKLADNRSPYHVAFVMESIYHFKSLQPAHFFFVPQSLSSDTETLPAKTRDQFFNSLHFR